MGMCFRVAVWHLVGGYAPPHALIGVLIQGPIGLRSGGAMPPPIPYAPHLHASQQRVPICSQNTLEHGSRISALGYESEKLRTVNKRAAAMRTAKVLEAFMGPGAWHADEVKTYAPACYHGLKLFDLKPRAGILKGTSGGILYRAPWGHAGKFRKLSSTRLSYN